MNLRRQLTSDSTLKLGRVALVGLAVALSAVACSFSTGDDNEPDNGNVHETGGQGGDDGTGGTDSGTGGEDSTTGGAGGDVTGGGGTGGQDPVTNVDCHEGGNVEGTPGDTTIDTTADGDDDCNKCLKTNCTAQFADCFATGPDSVCGWGVGDGDSEFTTAYGCMLDAFDEGKGSYVGSKEDVDACLLGAGSPSCDGTGATSVTRAIAYCLNGLDADGEPVETSCLAECALL